MNQIYNETKVLGFGVAGDYVLVLKRFEETAIVDLPNLSILVTPRELQHGDCL